MQTYFLPANLIYWLSLFLLLVVLSPPLQSNRELDAGLQEAVSTLLWVGPRLQSDVIELKVVSTVRT